VKNHLAILDLQGMQTPSDVRHGKSGASKGCGNFSGLSLLLCK
jgi:hypothetical protein